MKDDVINLLAAIGYTVTDADQWILAFCLEKVANTIKNECNIDIVPDGLKHVAACMGCGEFLLLKRRSGQLEDSAIQLDSLVKQIKEGDTSITYAVADETTATIDGMIDFLICYGKPQLIKYRRFSW